MPDLELTMRWQCSICGDVHAVSHLVPYPGGVYPSVYFPSGWRVIQGAWVCTNHTVRYLVDDGLRVFNEPAVTMAQREGRVDA